MAASLGFQVDAVDSPAQGNEPPSLAGISPPQAVDSSSQAVDSSSQAVDSPGPGGSAGQHAAGGAQVLAQR